MTDVQTLEVVSHYEPGHPFQLLAWLDKNREQTDDANELVYMYIRYEDGREYLVTIEAANTGTLEEVPMQ